MAQDSDKVDELFVVGEEFADAEQYTDALSSFQDTWDALPEPKDDQELAVQILAAVADCHFFLGAWDKCAESVQHAFRCGAELDNPFFRLRLGQSLYELGDEREAANWLVPVYLMEGRRPFESDDPKYLEFFRDKLQAPPDGWPDGW
ncbi:MAG: tetratricopeptide repeat protein [Gemmataceae bacterium]